MSDMVNIDAFIINEMLPIVSGSSEQQASLRAFLR